MIIIIYIHDNRHDTTDATNNNNDNDKGGVYNQEVFDCVSERVGAAVGDLDRCGLTMHVWNYAFIGAKQNI